MSLITSIYPLFSDNLVSWERYERERDALADKLANADTELLDTKKVFSMELGPKDHADRVKTAASMRKDIEGSFTAMVGANETLNQLLEDDMKMELSEQVRHCLLFFAKILSKYQKLLLLDSLC